MLWSSLPSIQNRHRDRLGVRGALARQADANDVFGIEIDTMGRLDGAERRRAEWSCSSREYSPRCGFGSGSAPMARAAIRSAASGTSPSAPAKSSDVADVVEAVAGVVGREILLGAEIDAEQVANGIRVLVAIQPAGGHAAGIGLDVPVGLFEFVLRRTS